MCCDTPLQDHRCVLPFIAVVVLIGETVVVSVVALRCCCDASIPNQAGGRTVVDLYDRV